MRKFLLTLKYLWFGFILGMKKTEDETLHASGIDLENGSTVNQKVSEHSVAKALLRGELTQEVIDLRYRTYEVARESTHYTYFSPTLAKKKKPTDNKFVAVENADNREIVTIQENKLDVETVTDSLLRINEDDLKFEDREKSYNINIERDCAVRFKIEQFMKKVVVKKGDDEFSAILDIYVSKYPDDKNFISKPFIKEVERIISSGLRSDIVEFNRLSFETYKAFKLDDMIRFEFGDMKFQKVFEYDGDYVFRFVSKIIDGGTDLTKEFYSERMAKKYREHAPKELTITYDPESNIRVYKCADCGKEVTYDARNLDSLAPKEARDITDEEQEADNGTVTEFLDFEMSEWDFGRMLCKDCAKKEQERLYQRMMEQKK